jgi:hypothetical protein
MPNEALQQKVDAISVAVCTILCQTLKSTYYLQNNLQNFAKLIRIANEEDVLTPIDICTALHFIEVIFATLIAAKKTSNLEWISSYPTQTAFDRIDALLCTVALGLAAKYNEDGPFNTRSFWMLHSNIIDSTVSLTEFNQAELKVLKLLNFTLPRNPNRINHFAQSIFINPVKTGSLSFSDQKANSATAFPYICNNPLIAPDSPQAILPAQYPEEACQGNNEPPIDDATRRAQDIIRADQANNLRIQIKQDNPHKNRPWSP